MAEKLRDAHPELGAVSVVFTWAPELDGSADLPSSVHLIANAAPGQVTPVDLSRVLAALTRAYGNLAEAATNEILLQFKKLASAAAAAPTGEGGVDA